MRRIFLISVLALAGCLSSGPRVQPVVPIVTDPVNLTPAQINVVRNVVANSLKDPDSAKFGEIRGAKFEGTSQELITVCGWVNAKNSFGGYVGMSPFMALYSIPMNKADIVKMGGGKELDNFQIQNRCLEKGIRL